jgi:HK97 family phage major capsid protein
MPTNPFEIPLQLGNVNWYPGTENLATTSTALATARQTLTAYELVAEVPWSLTLDEDAVIAMASEVRSSLVRNTVEVIDDVLLNADTTTTNNICPWWTTPVRPTTTTPPSPTICSTR